jgi:hypothetical protein
MSIALRKIINIFCMTARSYENTSKEMIRAPKGQQLSKKQTAAA